MTFSMYRLSPGNYSFLYAKSANIKDEDTFGSEAVTSTSIYYKLIQSIDDVKNDTAFGVAVINAELVIKVKKLQIENLNSLASGEKTIETYMELDKSYTKLLKDYQEELDNSGYKAKKHFVLTADHRSRHSISDESAANQEDVRTAIRKLSKMGNAYKIVIETFWATCT